MGETTKIQWASSSWNPWVGCTAVSPACSFCYAEKVGARMRVRWGPGEPRKRTSAANWAMPLRWNEKAAKEGRRHLVFCASLADVFDNEVPPLWRWDLMRLIDATPALTWLLLTKRIGNARAMLNDAAAASDNEFIGDLSWNRAVRPNVWLGISVGNQEEADRDVPKLLTTPAAKRFVSYEPALGPVDWRHIALNGGDFDALRGGDVGRSGRVEAWPALDWLIVGGESGPKARPFNITWARDTVDQCRAAGVPVFVKQLGARPYWDRVNGCGQWAPHVTFATVPLVSHPQGVHAIKLADDKGGDPTEWPEDLRVRAWPT